MIRKKSCFELKLFGQSSFWTKSS